MINIYYIVTGFSTPNSNLFKFWDPAWLFKCNSICQMNMLMMMTVLTFAKFWCPNFFRLIYENAARSSWDRDVLWDVWRPGVYCPCKQCCGSGSVWIRFILVSRIRFNETDLDPGSKKSAKIMENFNKNQQKSLEYHTFFSKLLNLCLLT